MKANMMRYLFFGQSGSGFTIARPVPQPSDSFAMISGVVYDTRTNKPINGATIAARDNLGDTLTAITNSNGYYELGLLKTAKYELAIFAP